MDARTEETMPGMDRLNEIFAWWGMGGADGNDTFEGQIRRFHLFASDLRKAYGDAYSRQMEALFTANDRIARSLQGLFRSREPDEVLAAESDILVTWLEGASLQARMWMRLGERVQDRCIAMAREIAEAMHDHRHQAALPQPEGERKPAGRANKAAARL